MKRLAVLFLIPLIISSFGCRRNSNEVLEDSRSAGRYMARGFKSLGGKHGDSRQVDDCGAFYPNDDLCYDHDDFVALQNSQGEEMIAMNDFPQAREIPGESGSSIPSLESFNDPALDPSLAAIFKNIRFEYNSDAIEGSQNLAQINNIANYMKNHPRLYVFIEGHCDERGPQAYNLALGARRANNVRNLLIRQGVDPDHMFTVSFGKERPLSMEHDEIAWTENRRAQFKIFNK